MNGSILDPSAAREHVAAWRRQIDGLAANTRAMRDRLQEVRVTARDPSGLAEVTVDSTGALVGLRLTDRMYQVAPAVVARTIMATLGEARNQLADRCQEIIAGTVGTESPAARVIADGVDRRFRSGPPPTRAAVPRGDDDQETPSYLREEW